MTEFLFKINDFFIDIGWGFPDFMVGVAVFSKLVLAVILGALLGYEREKAHKTAGLRTHILVCLGAVIFTLACMTRADSTAVDLAQVIKGIAAGIGFLGAGAILKEKDGGVKGLTTAASIWIAAALGLAIGAGSIWMAIVGAVFTWIVLSLDRQ